VGELLLAEKRSQRRTFQELPLILKRTDKRINQKTKPNPKHLSAADLMQTALAAAIKRKNDCFNFCTTLSIVLSTTLSTENLYFFNIKFEYKFYPKSIWHQIVFSCAC